ncbi:MAG: hypothetical protein KAJ48_02290 [Elusimicrobiales bacterium]|nr:hypothetical protein [Elusimicrobiales bacterium]
MSQTVLGHLPPHILMRDEPVSNLDIAGIERLENAYKLKRALIVISRNEQSSSRHFIKESYLGKEF